MKSNPASVYILIAITALAFLSGIYLKSTNITRSFELAPDAIDHYQDHAWYFELPSGFTSWAYIPSDSNSNPAKSLLTVEIDGVRLSPHQAHADLMMGKTGFSHWQGGVIFSTGENDPRITVESIIVTYPVIYPDIIIWLTPVVILLLMYLNSPAKFQSTLSFLDEQRYSVGWSILAAYSLLIIITIWTGYPDIPVVGLDGFSYITWAEKVPIGYPAFIGFIVKLFPGLKAVVIAQVIFYCAAVLIFYWQASKTYYSPYIALITGVALLGAGRIMNYNLVIGTDGILASILILHVAAVLAIIRSLSSQAMIMAGITVAIAIFIRPAAYFLVGGLALLFILLHGHRIRFITTSGAILLVLFLLFSQITTHIHGKERMSLLGLALFPHVMHLFDGSVVREHQQDALLVEDAISEYKAKMQQAIPVSWDTAYDLEMNNFNPISDRIHENLYQGMGKTEKRYKEILDLFEKFAIETVQQNPYDYLKIVMVNLYGSYSRYILLTVPSGYAQFEGAPFLHWFEKTRENALSGIRSLGLPTLDTVIPLQEYKFIKTPPAHLDLLQLLNPGQIYILILAVSILLLGLLTPLRFEPVQLSGLYALILHFGGTLLVCLSTIAIPRYSVPLDTLLLVSIGCALNMMVVHAVRMKRRSNGLVNP